MPGQLDGLGPIAPSVATGRLLLIGRCWSVATDPSLLVGRCWSVAAGRPLLVGCCWAVAAGPSLLVRRCWVGPCCVSERRHAGSGMLQGLKLPTPSRSATLELRERNVKTEDHLPCLLLSRTCIASFVQGSSVLYLTFLRGPRSLPVRRSLPAHSPPPEHLTRFGSTYGPSPRSRLVGSVLWLGRGRGVGQVARCGRLRGGCGC